MMVLVVGLLEFDSGKTSVTASLVREARSRGIDAVAMKPVGSHNAWSQHASVLRSLKMKVLVGEDAYRLWLASEKAEPVELLSPLDILTAPPDLTGFEDVAEYLSALGSLTAQATLMRITRPPRSTRHYLIKDNAERVLPSLRVFISELARLLEAESIRLNEAFKMMTHPHPDEALAFLRDRHELLIVESFNNAAYPSPLSLEADKVILVAPGRAYVYEGSEYCKAVRDSISSRGPRVTTPELIGRIRPLAAVSLKPRDMEELDNPKEDTRELLNLVMRY